MLPLRLPLSLRLSLLLLAPLATTAQTNYPSVFTPNDTLFCYDAYQIPASPLPHDCLAALAMIPTGLSVFPELVAQHNPPLSPTKPITLALDKRLYTLPTAFRSRSCVVRVWATRPLGMKGRTDQGFESGELYFKLWPRVREAVGEIVRRCVEGEREGEGAEPGQEQGGVGQGAGGSKGKEDKGGRARGTEGGYEFSSMMGGHPVTWQVRVKYQDQFLRTDTWQPGDDHPLKGTVYNVKKTVDWAPGSRKHGMLLRGGGGGGGGRRAGSG